MVKLLSRLLFPILAVGLLQAQRVPVSPIFFGGHYNQTSTAFQTKNFPLGMPLVRLWDTKSAWGDMQAGPNCNATSEADCTFTKLDEWIAKFGGQVPIMLTLGKVPNFNAKGCGTGSTQTKCTATGVTQSEKCNYPPLGTPNGSCTPPKDLNCDGTGKNDVWIQFLTRLIKHVKPGTIQYLEIWNEFNIQGFWDSPYIQQMCTDKDSAIKMLTRLTQDAQCVVQGRNCNPEGTYPETAMDPAMKLLSPTPSGPGTDNKAFLPGGMEYNLIAAGIGKYVDIISTHGYTVATPGGCAPPANSGCMVPEAMDSALDILRDNMKAAGTPDLPIVISEMSWGSNSGAYDPQYIEAFMGRRYASLAQKNVLSVDWYYLATGSDDCQIGPVLEKKNGTLCPTGSAYKVIQGWLTGATLVQPTYTKHARADCAAGSSVYEYPLRLATGQSARIVAYDGMANTSSCSYTVVPAMGYTTYYDMTGASHVLGATLTLDNRPVLLTAPLGK